MVDLRQETIDTYNNSAEALACYFQSIGSRKKDIEKALLAAGTMSSARVVEIGCGDGRDAKEIAKHCSYFTAFDVSEELIKIAQKGAPNINFEVADAVGFRFPNNLDVVFAFASLLHLDKNEFQLVLAHVAKALRTGGIAYLSLKYKASYQSYIKQDKFGKRLFYFYNQAIIEQLAGPEFKTVDCYVKTHGETDWIEITLQKQ